MYLYRGSPDFQRDPQAGQISRDERARWGKDPKIAGHHEPMLYGWGRETPKESGVDMRLGLDLVKAAESRAFEKIVLFCGDSDLAPSAQDVMKTTTPLEHEAWADGQDKPGNALTEICRRKFFRVRTHLQR